MAQIQRQNNFFAAEDFRTIKRTISEINFTAYDFDSIKAAMVEYIQRHFPEEFNDFMLSDGYENLFRFPKFVEFVKSITSETN